MQVLAVYVCAFTPASSALQAQALIVMHYPPFTPHLSQPNACIYDAISLLPPHHAHAHTSSPQDYLGLFSNAGHPTSKPHPKLQSSSFGLTAARQFFLR